MYMLGLVLCRGHQVWHEIVLQLDRQTRTKCSDVQLTVMVISTLQSKEVKFDFTPASSLIERNSIFLFYLYKFRGH